MSNLQQKMHDILTGAFTPVYLEIINQSHLHAGHAGDDGSGESHFKITITAASFAGHSRVTCHRMVFDVLKVHLDTLPHAVSLTAHPPQDEKPG